MLVFGTCFVAFLFMFLHLFDMFWHFWKWICVWKWLANSKRPTSALPKGKGFLAGTGALGAAPKSEHSWPPRLTASGCSELFDMLPCNSIFCINHHILHDFDHCNCNTFDFLAKCGKSKHKLLLHIWPSTIGDMLAPGWLPIGSQFLGLLRLPKPARRHHELHQPRDVSAPVR